MSLSSASKLYIVELVIYGILAPFTVYLLYRHGRNGLLGYFYLNAYCLIRIIADIIELLPGNRDPTPGHITTAQAVLSAVGLSPLLLALSGFLHEAHVYLVQITAQGQHQQKTTKKWLWIIQLQVHTVCWTGMALIIAGSVGLADSSGSLSSSQRNTDLVLRKVGIVLILLLLGTLALYSVFLVALCRRTSISTRRLTPLLGAIIVSVPFLSVRDIYTVVSVFDDNSSDLNPVTGALWVKVVFIVLTPLCAVLVWCIGGWKTRNIRRGVFSPERSSGAQAVGWNSNSADMEKRPRNANDVASSISSR